MTTATESLASAQRAFAPFRALVVDQQPLIRDSIAGRLRGLGASAVVECDSAAAARAVDVPEADGLCVLDLGLADGPGISLLTDLRAAGWQRLVVLSAADDPLTVRAAFVAGADGYLLKSSSAAIVLDGLRHVLAGGAYADPALTPRLITGADSGSDLSSREIEVLQLVAEGRTNKQVGELLGLSALTVKSHLARIARKLGTGDRAEMVAQVLRAGLIR